MLHKFRLQDLGITFAALVLPARKFCHEAAGDNDVDRFVDCLERLKSYQTIYTHFDGSRGSGTEYIKDFKYDKASGEISVIIDIDKLRYFSDRGWIIDVKRIRALKQAPARALAMFLSQQPGRDYSAADLINRCNIGSEKVKEQRRKLKLALEELKEKGFIDEFEVVGDDVSLRRVKPVIETKDGGCVV